MTGGAHVADAGAHRQRPRAHRIANGADGIAHISHTRANDRVQANVEDGEGQNEDPTSLVCARNSERYCLRLGRKAVDNHHDGIHGKVLRRLMGAE